MVRLHPLCCCQWGCPILQPHRWLIESRLSGESGVLHDTIIIMKDAAPGSLCLPEIKGGPSPFVYVPHPQPELVFDTRTRLLYKFPEFRIALVCHDEANIAGVVADWLTGQNIRQAQSLGT